ncbi:hypothetical protein FB45DRAFT_1032008 [Roridomyces roridus]|uniref:IBR domain-containing protein n=1 Tax=Roridomyces roridus TaxID=1738132 RepID=A0AAD7BJ50_9AGAR|nr:hypothetical protein FB45DRAFT_1032008 [Roridomyces roridus]
MFGAPTGIVNASSQYRRMSEILELCALNVECRCACDAVCRGTKAYRARDTGNCIKNLPPEQRESPEDAALHQLAQGENWRQCPDCGAYIERISGCNHMRCGCGYRFCFRCLYPLSRDSGQCTHNPPYDINQSLDGTSNALLGMVPPRQQPRAATAHKDFDNRGQDGRSLGSTSTIWRLKETCWKRPPEAEPETEPEFNLGLKLQPLLDLLSRQPLQRQLHLVSTHGQPLHFRTLHQICIVPAHSLFRRHPVLMRRSRGYKNPSFLRHQFSDRHMAHILYKK